MKRFLALVERIVALEWAPAGPLARWISLVLGILGAGLSVVLFLGVLQNSLSLELITEIGAKKVVLGVVASMAANACLFLGWKSLTVELPISYRAGFSLYARSALARYIPTGFGHLLVRQLSADQFLIERRGLLRVSAWELAAALLVAGLLSISLLLPISSLSYLVGIGALLFTLVLGRLKLKRKSRGLPLSLVSFIGYYMLASLAIVSFRGERSDLAELAGIVAAYSAAWMISTLVPFFPGGVGLREITFIGIVSAESTADGYDSAIVLLRVSLWLAELLFAAFSLLGSRHRK